MKMQLFTNLSRLPSIRTLALLPDSWLATSTLQKAIRRGETETALLATAYLIEKQPARFWRRLVVIALEDVGIADLRLVEEVLLASGRPSWRAEHGGEEHWAADLVTRLCGAAKNRDACDALVIADLHPDFARQRSGFLDYSGYQLCDVLADRDRSIGERVLAAWMVTGTKRFPAYSLPERGGSFSELLTVYDAIGVPPDVLKVARYGSTRTNEGHPLTIPLIWLLSNQEGGVARLETAALPRARSIGGWPEYSFDMHTRPGKVALRLFGYRCGDLQKLLIENLRTEQWQDFIGTLVFRAEGEVVDRRQVFSATEAVRRDAEAAHLTYQGFPATLATEALEVVRGHTDLLYSCRVEALRG